MMRLQVRNTATLGGNIVTASPISDINAIMMAAGAVYELASSAGKTSNIEPQQFLTGYRHALYLPKASLHGHRACVCDPNQSHLMLWAF